eukprot:scaffold56669_cov57-Attheya_sp.AAC.4
MELLLDNSLAINDEQNANSTKAFNRDDAPVDFAVLDRIEQRSTMKMHLDHPPTGKAIEKHIQKVARDKAGGESTITGRGIKALGLVSKHVIKEIFTAFWHGDSDYKEWYEAILKWLPKKRNLLQANNWRGICLGDALAKLFSSILMERLNEVMKVDDIEN